MSLHCFVISLLWLITKVEGDISNNLVDDVKYPHCDVMLEKIPFRDVETSHPLREKDLMGTWYSQRCETRPGLVHVLRSYDFLGGGHINLTLHVYEDAFCRTAKFSVFAQGRFSLTRKSMVTPGAMEAEYFISEMCIIPQSLKSVSDLVETLNRTSCSTNVIKSLKPEQCTSIFHSPVSLNQVTLSDYSCVPSFVSSWNELQLMRVEVEGRSYSWRDGSCHRKELFLGDLHSNPKNQPEYRPTAYQVPLLHKECTKECDVCELFLAGSSPPVVPYLPLIQPPKLLEGHWASTRCEVQRYGLFLTRKISFKSLRRRWVIKQRYFYDPRCKRATYTIVASGHYKRVSKFTPKSAVVHFEGRAFDMTVRKMSITPEDKSFAAQLNRILGRVCGVRGLWRKGKPQDVTGTGGCSPIGLKVPTKEPEIMRFEKGDNGQVFLYLGQTPTWPHRGRGPPPRPTAWGPKLQKCSSVPQPEHNDLRPMVGIRMALVSGSDQNRHSNGQFWVYSIFVCLWKSLLK